MKLRGNNTDGNNRRRFISDPPVEDFTPEMRFDWEDDHLRRMQRDEDVEEELTADFLARLKML